MREREKRNSGIEALRIIAMLMIIAYHYVVHGKAIETGGGTKIFLECASLWGKAGVNLFCLIMGYFGIQSKFNVKKVFQMEAQVVFYSLFGLFAALLFKCRMSFGKVVMTFFPTVFNQYWFITAYIMVYIISPFINRLLLKLDGIHFRRLISIFIAFWCAVPFFTLQENSGLFWNQFIWFVVMYVIGAYLRLNKRVFPKRIYLLVLLICNVILVASVIGTNWLSTYILKLAEYTIYARWSNSPLIICVCISMMRLVECRQIGHIKWINYLATGTLGIYLFHENVFIRDILWNNLFNNTEYIGSYAIVIHIMAAIAFVFLTGSVIDVLRRLLFVKTDTVFSFISDGVEKKVKDYEQKIDKIFNNGC